MFSLRKLLETVIKTKLFYLWATAVWRLVQIQVHLVLFLGSKTSRFVLHIISCDRCAFHFKQLLTKIRMQLPLPVILVHNPDKKKHVLYYDFSQPCFFTICIFLSTGTKDFELACKAIKEEGLIIWVAVAGHPGSPLTLLDKMNEGHDDQIGWPYV
jgi:hypothetical protein